jgi:hypothetical protein
LINLPVADDSKCGSDNDKKNSPVVESLSIWPAIANLLKAEQYDQAVELLKAKLARPSIDSEVDVAFLVMARQIAIIILSDRDYPPTGARPSDELVSWPTIYDVHPWTNR